MCVYMIKDVLVTLWPYPLQSVRAGLNSNAVVLSVVHSDAYFILMSASLWLHYFVLFVGGIEEFEEEIQSNSESFQGLAISKRLLVPMVKFIFQSCF